jgi:hypothetical protein
MWDAFAKLKSDCSDQLLEVAYPYAQRLQQLSWDSPDPQEKVWQALESPRKNLEDTGRSEFTKHRVL